MFTKTGINTVESTDGFFVSRNGRNELSYMEHCKSLMIEVESGESLAVYAASIKNWQPLFEGEVISEGKKAEILSRVSAALQFMEVPHVIY